MTTYKIADLLLNGEQPWGPLDADTYDALRSEIHANKGFLTVPVIVSSRGRLIDGHHRLMIVQEYGRKTLRPEEVRMDRKVKTSEDEALAAINYQRLRRQTTTADNAKVARDLMRRFGWSQNTVAQKMGVSGAAVSQWLKAHPDPTFELTERKGLDGKTYTVEPEIEAEPEMEKPKRRSMKGPDSHIARHRAEIVNDEFRQWVISWGADADATVRERVATDLNDIAAATSSMAETLRTFIKDDEGF